MTSPIDSDRPVETTVMARLPMMDVAVHHRRHPGNAEILAVAVRTAPSFGAVAQGWPWLATPMLGWIIAAEMSRAMWLAWLTPTSRLAAHERDRG